MFAVEKTIWACSYCKHVLRLNVIPSTRTDNIHLRTVRFKSTAGYRNYYDVLGVDKHATQETIKAQFIKLSKENHPDVSKVKAGSHERFVRINEAYKVLSKPASRSQYDATLQYGNLYRNHAYAGTYRPRPQTTQRGQYKYPPKSDYEFNPGYAEWERYQRQMREMNGKSPEEVALFKFIGAVMFMIFLGMWVQYSVYKLSARRTARMLEADHMRQEEYRRRLQEERLRYAEIQHLDKDSQLEHMRKRMIETQYRRRYLNGIPEEINKSE